MLYKTNPRADQKLQYKKVMQLCMIFALLFLIGMFQMSKRFDKGEIEQLDFVPFIEVQEIPPTEQPEKPPAPSRPAVPIESESEDIPEDETITTTELNWTDIPKAPAPPSDTGDVALIFVPYDKDPEPIGGMAAIQKNLVYPEMARKAGVEGMVIVQVVIDKAGNLVSAKVIKSLGNNGCDEAAIAAIKSVKWKSALQRDEPVTVLVAISVIFKLR